MIRSLLLVLGLCLGFAAQAQTVGPVPTPNCTQVTSVTGLGATALTQFVAAQPGQRVYICGITFNTGAAAATFQLQYGTGTNCAAGTTALTPAWSLGVNGVIVNRSSVVGEITPAAQAACYVITGTGPTQASIYWVQF